MNSKNKTTSAEIGQNSGKNPGERKHICPECDKVFTRKQNLNQHLIIHSGDKRIECQTCSQQFARKNYLKKHMLIHSGEKPYECPTCHKWFTQKGTLNRHLITHSDLSVQFNSHVNVKTHFCNSCDKEFYQKSDLIRHLNLHTGLKPYVCDVCKKGFARKNDLVNHSRIHSGEKPFSCSTCKRPFAQKSGLKRHLKIHSSSQLLKNSPSKPKVFLQEYDELLNKFGCSSKYLKIVCNKLTDDEIKQHSSKVYLGNVKQEVDAYLEPYKSNFCFEVPLIKQELMNEGDLKTPSCSYQTLNVKQEPIENADPACLNLCDDSFIKAESELPTTI